MAASADLLLLPLLLLAQGWLGAGAGSEAVVCAATACYQAHWGKLSAAEAQEQCRKDGGNLATVKSEEEARHVQKALARLLRTKATLEMKMGRFWIGLQREKGKCQSSSLPLKGFVWVDGEEETVYSNWYKEVKGSCISARCVSLLQDLSLTPHPSHLPRWSDSPCGSPGSPVSNIEGFLCKFNFKGMCKPLSLGGPGQVTYTAPFQATTSSLEAVPFGTAADVVCEDETERKSHYFICKEKTPGVFDWGSSGPLCVTPKYGCNFNNGGCQQDCFEGGDGSFHCGCRPGFQLLDDLVTCISRNPCSSSPCKGQATCVPLSQWGNYTCHCPLGYQLDSSQLNCVDVDECRDSPCDQECVNTPGGFYCECWVGYQPGGSEVEACRDVDECAAGQSPCAQGCINTNGSFYCDCEQGYVLSGEDGTQCEDVDECLDPRGSPCTNGVCINTNGSFYCGCQPGSKLTPNGNICISDLTSSELPARFPQERGEGDGERSTSPLAAVSSPTRGSEGLSRGTSTTRGPLFPSEDATASTSLEMLAFSGPAGIWTEIGTHLPTATSTSKSTEKDSVATLSDDGTDDGQKLLLFYILGTVVAISLLLALALGLLIYRKRRAKREEIKKPQNAADSYSWVPERAESRALENQYSPTPGTDC
uniref:complement component C1q receptor n=1 Tax=Jaculus jaculus TaxID=51337 RepID=UPI001E1B2AE9|nr:complement component C1q receptor [Jaculus jaculus]